MTERVSGDPRRLADVSQDVRQFVDGVREATARYQHTVGAFNTAGPNDLGRTVADLSPRIASRLDRLDALGRVPGDFALGLAALERAPGPPSPLELLRLDQRLATPLERSGTPGSGGGSPWGDPIGWLKDQAWFMVPWTLYSGATDLVDVYRFAVPATRLQRIVDLYYSQVAAFSHLPDSVRMSHWMLWQQEASRTVGLDRALAALPEGADYRAQLHRAGQFDTGWRLPSWLRSGGRVLGRVAVPVGALFDVHTLHSPQSTNVDRGFAVAGLGAAGVAGAVALGIVSSPVIIGAGIVAGVAATGYGIYKLWDEYGGAIIDWVGSTWTSFTTGVGDAWDWTTDRVGATYDHVREAIGTATDWAGDRVQDATDAIGTATDWAGDRVRDVNDAIDTVGSTLSGTRDAASRGWNAVTDTLGW